MTYIRILLGIIFFNIIITSNLHGQWDSSGFHLDKKTITAAKMLALAEYNSFYDLRASNFDSILDKIKIKELYSKGFTNVSFLQIDFINLKSMAEVMIYKKDINHYYKGEYSDSVILYYLNKYYNINELNYEKMIVFIDPIDTLRYHNHVFHTYIIGYDGFRFYFLKGFRFNNFDVFVQNIISGFGFSLSSEIRSSELYRKGKIKKLLTKKYLLVENLDLIYLYKNKCRCRQNIFN